ncbi:MAG TPA: DUF58 domain-containing protein [Chloroflexota bacterium]|jgi:uncharacterized protein (DUF58 family)|nr:DUF58 domain-containing protein [Chloroflexota bacterium]
MAGPQTLLDGAFARRLERLSLVSRKRLIGQGQGDRRSLRKGSSLEFADYRHYVEGDDPARVDWNIYSRTDTLFVRLYEEEEVLNVHLVVDASRSMDWGEPSKLRYARRLAAALGYVALNASNRVFVWPLGATNSAYGPAWGRGRAGAMLAFVDEFKPVQISTPQVAGLGAPPDLEQSLSSFTSRAGGLVILISDLLSPNWEKALGRLAVRSGEAVVLHTLSPQELRPGLGGDVRLIDRESGAAVSVTLNNDAIRLYGQRLDEWRRAVESFSARHGIAYVPIDTSMGLETVVFDVLRRRGIVR